MTLYHGTTEIITKIDFSKSNLRTDFGKGFYMGSKLGEARNWAIGKVGCFWQQLWMQIYKIKLVISIKLIYS